ncbi:unnamed protein product, partial [marine sediment metagenome]
KSMALAIKKAKKMGLGMVAVRNSTHYGIAGYYILMAIKAGMIGISGTNARPSIAPTFGVENMLGTNPLKTSTIKFSKVSKSTQTISLELLFKIIPSSIFTLSFYVGLINKARLSLI